MSKIVSILKTIIAPKHHSNENIIEETKLNLNSNKGSQDINEDLTIDNILNMIDNLLQE